MPYSEYNILLADDDPDDCLLFSEVLQELGIQRKPTVVGNGEELINYLKDAILLPDILFLDINMPLKDGITALQEIKNDKTLRQLPVIMLSTTKHPGTVQVAYNMGANLYACKPNGYSQSVNLIQKILSLDVTGLLSHRSLDRFLIEND
jgi:CheY-like chemotaxis protein